MPTRNYRICLRALSVLVTLGGLSAVVLAAGPTATGRKGLVVAGHRAATEAGLRVLARGGNAIDAAVAVSLSLGVAEPYGSGLGGKLVLLYYERSSGQVWCVEALGAAPLAADSDAFFAIPPPQRQLGYRAVCVPGLVAGLWDAHRRWGRAAWSGSVEEAVVLAERGFSIGPLTRAIFACSKRDLLVDSEASRLYLSEGKLPRGGAMLMNPDQAAMLRLIASGGRTAYYEGPMTRQIVAASQATGGYLSLEDFRRYAPRVRCAASGPYRGYTVHTSQSPAVGGTTLLAALGALESQSTPAAPRKAQYIDRVGRVLQVVYQRVYRELGDVEDADERTARLLGPAAAAQLWREALARDPREPLAMNHEASLDDSPIASTSHFVVVDAEGNVVSATQSLASRFGAAVVAPGTGFLLNNSMNNFSAGPRGPNVLEPGKRPRSTMTPTLLTRDGQAVLALGTPAGQRIPTSVLQIVLDVVDHGRDLPGAISAPRFHVRRPLRSSPAPNLVDLEVGSATVLDGDLSALGWDVARWDEGQFYFGGVNAALVHADGTVEGVADSRRTNWAASQDEAETPAAPQTDL